MMEHANHTCRALRTGMTRVAQIPLGRVAGYAAVVCGIVSLFVLAWMLREVLLIAFGAIVFASVIRALAHPLISRAGWRERWAVSTAVVTIVLVLGSMGWLFGRQVANELSGITERLPEAVEAIRTWLEDQPGGSFVVQGAAGLGDDAGLQQLGKFAVLGVATVGHVVLIFFGGIFIAANPGLYRGGLVRLFPPRHRAKLDAALIDAGEALRKWLLGQFVAMLSVGVLTGIGLALVGAPLALGLGVVAGLLDFVPVIGPIIAAVPGILVAFTDSPQTALYAAIVYLVVQQIESHAITPLAQRWAVKLPPAYGMIAVLSFGLLFGIPGVVIGTPLAVVVMRLVQTLYVKNGLEE